LTYKKYIQKPIKEPCWVAVTGFHLKDFIFHGAFYFDKSKIHELTEEQITKYNEEEKRLIKESLSRIEEAYQFRTFRFESIESLRQKGDVFSAYYLGCDFIDNSGTYKSCKFDIADKCIRKHIDRD